MSSSKFNKSKPKKKETISFILNDNGKENNAINNNNKKENKNKDNKQKTSNEEEIIFMNQEEKEGYCVNKYDNGDSYFGYYAKDYKNYHGFYFFNQINIYDYNLVRCYLGFWRNDLRHGYGIYLWAKETKGQKFYENFDKSNFKAFIGNFDWDNLNKGTYLSKENDDYFVYHGTFSENNKKDGNDCFYFSSNLEELLYGTFKNNEFIEGYIGKFNDDGEIEDLLKYKNDNAENLENNKEYENIKNIMANFRNCIMSEDYFGIVFEVFSRGLKFKEEYLFNMDIINTYKNEDFLDICKSYKKITIFHDIEKCIKLK